MPWGFRVALALLATGLLNGQSFDAGNNPRLGGYYYVRLVSFSGVTSTGSIARARALSGVITFNGAGGYTVDGQLADNRTTPVSVTRFTGGGIYMVASSGMAELQNPFDPAQTIRAAVGDLAVVGSSTEGDIHDLFIAVPVGGDVTGDAVAGTWRAAYLDFPEGNSTLARTAFFSMAADGQGGLGEIAVNGNGINMGPVSQTVSGGSYLLSQNGAGGLRFPAAAGRQLIAGDKIMYLSADRNIMLGGSASGFDMLVAVRGVSGAGNASYKGLYYMAGARVDPFEISRGINHFFFYSGSVNADGGYSTVWHYRINPAGTPSYDLTRVGGFLLDNDGVMTAPGQHIALGADGDAFIETGNSDAYHFVFGVRVRPTAGDGPWLNPIGVVNGASFAPATNPVAPGEVVALFGSGLAAEPVAASGPPLPFSLGGVQVLVNGRPAPLMYASPDRITAVVPYDTKEKFATFQAFRDGQASNRVTAYNNLCSPGVFLHDRREAWAPGRCCTGT